jgi:hypothetical protein
MEVMNFMKIELSECPEILQEAVKKYLSENGSYYAKVIHVDKNDSTPYVDRSIIHTVFCVTVQNFNYFNCFTYFDNDEHLKAVYTDGINAGTIIDIIKNAEDDYFDHINAR